MSFGILAAHAAFLRYKERHDSRYTLSAMLQEARVAWIERMTGQKEGVLAVQMPRQYGAPSHRFLRDFAAEMFPDRFDLASWKAPVGPPVEYHRMLSELGRVDVWETDYVQRLDPAPEGHPVRRFTQSTAMRPYLDALSAAEAADFIRRYDQGLAAAYPVESDGSVLFPFRRLFFTLRR